MLWRRTSKRLREQRPYCQIHMLYVLVELGLAEIIPWWSKLDNEIQYRFIKRKGYDGEIKDTELTDHIIPIKAPFYGAKLDRRNLQCASHEWHNVKRRLERDEIVEEYVETKRGRVPVRMLDGLKKYSDPGGVKILQREALNNALRRDCTISPKLIKR